MRAASPGRPLLTCTPCTPCLKVRRHVRQLLNRPRHPRAQPALWARPAGGRGAGAAAAAAPACRYRFCSGGGVGGRLPCVPAPALLHLHPITARPPAPPLPTPPPHAAAAQPGAAGLQLVASRFPLGRRPNLCRPAPDGGGGAPHRGAGHRGAGHAAGAGGGGPGRVAHLGGLCRLGAHHLCG